MKTQKKHAIFSFFLAIGMLFSLFALIGPMYSGTESEGASSHDILKTPKTSAQYSESWVHIDGNWSQTESAHDWCVKRGNTYYIENLTVDNNNQGHGIWIENTDEYFVMNNVKVNDSKIGWAALIIESVSNGSIYNCEFNDNSGYGLILTYLDNFTIRDSEVNNNGQRGFSIVECNNTEIDQCKIGTNVDEGLFLEKCLGFNITDNKIENNDYAIYLDSSNNTFVSGNKLGANTNDIVQTNTENNEITVNSFEGIWTPILIDDSGANNLTWAEASALNWCNGSGTLSDPYTIQNMVIDADGQSGIFIQNSKEHFLITNCNITTTGTASAGGIQCSNNQFGIISNCNLTSPNAAGISLYQNCNDTKVESNILTQNKVGIRLFDCINISIENNEIYNNTEDGINIYNAWECIVKENNIYNNSYQGINLYYTAVNNTFTGNNLIENVQNGIKLSWRSENNTVSNNTIKQNQESGINIYGSSPNIGHHNTIYNNTIMQNTNGIKIQQYTHNNTLYDNIVAGNEQYGILIDDITAEDYIFYNNNITDNGINAFDAGTDNLWNNSLTGNYWSNYSEVIGGVDADDDGFGDADYEIPGGTAKDMLPIWDDGHSGTKIHIDDTGASGKTWEELALMSFCSGSGTQADPYTLSGLTIDAEGSGSAILIENSNAYFTVSTSNLSNSESHASEGGIKIQNSQNANLIGNNCSFNGGNGILIIESSKINISYGEYNNNSLNGIKITESSDIIIQSVQSSNNTYGVQINSSDHIGIYQSNATRNNIGIRIINSNHTQIIGNNSVSFNTEKGIALFSSNNCTIDNNMHTINSNAMGIYLNNSHQNNITLNSITNNEYGIYLNSSNSNRIAGNTLIGNTQGILETSSSTGNIFLNNLDDSISDEEENEENGDSSEGDGDKGDDIDLVMIIIIAGVAGGVVAAIVVISKKGDASDFRDKQEGEEKTEIPSPTRKATISEKEKLIKAQYFQDRVKNDPNGPINQESVINFTNLEAFESPQKIKDILKTLYQTAESFIPRDVPEYIQSHSNLSELDAEYYTFKAFNAGVFTAVSELKKARETESEIEIEKDEFICIVHKGPVTGENIYVCPNCNAIYCRKCAAALKQKGENCWSCEKQLEIKVAEQEDTLELGEQDSSSAVNGSGKQEEIRILEDYMEQLKKYLSELESSYKQGKISQEDYLEHRNETAQKMGETQGKLEKLKN